MSVPANPDAARSLLEIERLRASCCDCGHTVRISRDELAGIYAGGVTTFGELWKLAFCKPCRDAGGRRRAVHLHAEWLPAPSDVLVRPPPISANPLSQRRRLYQAA